MHNNCGEKHVMITGIRESKLRVESRQAMQNQCERRARILLQRDSTEEWPILSRL